LNESRRQLLIAWTYLEWGGAQIYLIAIIKEARADWDITVIMPRSSSPEIIRFVEDAGAQVEFIDAVLDLQPAETFKRKVERIYRRFRAEWAVLQALRKYDLRRSILHVETAPWQAWQFLAALSLRGAHIFVTLHNALPPAPRWRELVWRARFRFASRLRGFHIFTSNHDTKNKFRGWVSDEFWDSIRVTYTCVNPPEIDEALQAAYPITKTRESYGVRPDDLLVLCLGQFIDRKGRWIFLEAAKKVAEQNEDVMFIWVTPKLPDEKEQQRIESFGLGDRFKLVLSETIAKEHKDILKFYRIADVYTLPSYVEGLPIALLEAMAIGVPSISTNVYAIPEAVHDRETGLLIPPGDADALAAAILEIKNNRGLRRQLSHYGREYVMHNFDERTAARIAIEAYERSLEHRP